MLEVRSMPEPGLAEELLNLFSLEPSHAKATGQPEHTEETRAIASGFAQATGRPTHAEKSWKCFGSRGSGLPFQVA